MSTPSTVPDRYKLVFFVPTENAEACKEAIFASHGTGQFLPGDGANPAIGAVGEVERVEELRIEVMCIGRDLMLKAVEELIRAHPYEEVAYEVYRMENV
ncbi:uncharacterized protein N7477_000891 [Penicillium maclennaniae]|uniref:uncharacterized protein n=1 Tax=Penicillium maclennaniae TaxID=1343394 RepID=UPI00254172FA|nr:uncharacterized protein N7477_000891 [Penicillium maclennaniae]KAJ5684546.1 hypothetical protein N7477_000891 [Penicillium maclennaniae]